MLTGTVKIIDPKIPACTENFPTFPNCNVASPFCKTNGSHISSSCLLDSGYIFPGDTPSS